MTELKPCPFCGCEYEKDDDDFFWAGDHENWCPLSTTYPTQLINLIVPDEKEAIEAWNRRPTMKTEKQLANEQHMKIVAEKLNGREYGSELTDEEEQQLKNIGLVVAFGYSDDNVEFRGAFVEEVGGYDDFEIPFLDGDVLFKRHDECNEYVCPLWKDAIGRAKTIRATFKNEGWKFETDFPCEKFTIMDDGEVYGEGIVFAYEDIGGKV